MRELTPESDEILRIARLLWPHARPSVVGRTESPKAGISFAVVPNLSAPRILAPVAAPRAGASAMLEGSDALSTRQRASRVAAAMTLRLGGSRLASTHLVIEGDTSESLAGYLGEVMGRPVTMVIGIGTLRANRKPVVRVTGADGSMLGYAKVGVSDLTNDLVQGEHAALQQLGERRWRTLRLPSVWHFGQWGSHNVLVIRPVPTPLHLRAPRRLRPPQVEVTELAEAWGTVDQPLGDSPFVRSLATSVPGGPAGEELAAGLTALVGRYGAELVRTGAWHGDFTPWNMVRADGRLSLWDWERFSHGVPSGLDEIHFEVNLRTRQRGLSQDSVAAGLVAGTEGSATSRARALRATYLAVIATRYTLDDLATEGAVLAEASALMRRLLLKSAGGDHGA